MSLKVVLQPEAQVEFDESFDWYERRMQGLGMDFADRIHDVLNRIAVTPLMHQKVYHQIRRAVVSCFPFNIYYRVEATEVVVVSVFHTSRSPKVWKSRA